MVNRRTAVLTIFLPAALAFGLATAELAQSLHACPGSAGEVVLCVPSQREIVLPDDGGSSCSSMSALSLGAIS